MSDSQFKERGFDIENLDRSNWRSRINQFKRELKSTQGFLDSPQTLATMMQRRAPKRSLGRGNRSWDQRRSATAAPRIEVEQMAR
jgi:hypothetical protein